MRRVLFVLAAASILFGACQGSSKKPEQNTELQRAYQKAIETGLKAPDPKVDAEPDELASARARIKELESVVSSHKAKIEELQTKVTRAFKAIARVHPLSRSKEKSDAKLKNERSHSHQLSALRHQLRVLTDRVSHLEAHRDGG